MEPKTCPADHKSIWKSYGDWFFCPHCGAERPEELKSLREILAKFTSYGSDT